MFRHRRHTKILAGFIFAIALVGSPLSLQRAYGQDAMPEAASAAETKAAPAPPAGDPKAAITTKDPTMEVEDLQLLVRPLPLDELQNEAAAWMLLVKTKAKEISDAEIAIKRQNRSITKQQEAVTALETAKKALEEAEKGQKASSPGSPEYEAATKKVEEAKAQLQKAQDSVKEAAEIKQESKEDKALQNALKDAAKTGEIDDAKKLLETLKSDRDKLTAGTPNYDQATAKIDKLEAAIKTLEEAQEDQQKAVPNTPDFKAAKQQVEKATQELRQIQSEINGGGQPETNKTDQSNRQLDQSVASLEKTEIRGDTEKQVAGSPGQANLPENLQQQGDKLKQTSDKLEQNTEAETEIKNQLVANVTELQSARTALIDRFNVVLTELERKGGDASAYRKYIEAISIVEIDLKDTEGVGVRLLRWVQSDEGGLRWASNIGKFGGIVLLVGLSTQALGILFNTSLKKAGVSTLLRQFLVMLVKRGGIVLGVLIALTALEVSLGPLLALLGGASFVLAFALQSNLGNFASGLMLMVYKPFDVGDEVKIGEIWAWVDSITLASTKLKGFAGQMYTIPNNVVWTSTIQNLTHTEIRKVVIWLRVSFHQNLAEVEKLVIETIKSVPKVLSDPAPATFVWNIEEYYISVNASAWATKADYWEVYAEVIRKVRAALDESGLGVAAVPAEIKIGMSGEEFFTKSYRPQLMPEQGAKQGTKQEVVGESTEPTVQEPALEAATPSVSNGV